MMIKLSFISLLYLYKIPIERADDAISIFDLTLRGGGIYNKYKHLNPYFYTCNNGDWLIPLAIRYKKDEWIEFRLWLRTIILDILNEENYDKSLLNGVL